MFIFLLGMLIGSSTVICGSPQKASQPRPPEVRKGSLSFPQKVSPHLIQFGLAINFAVQVHLRSWTSTPRSKFAMALVPPQVDWAKTKYNLQDSVSTRLLVGGDSQYISALVAN